VSSWLLSRVASSAPASPASPVARLARLVGPSAIAWEADHLAEALARLDLVEAGLEVGEGQHRIDHRAHGAAGHERHRLLQVRQRGADRAHDLLLVHDHRDRVAAELVKVACR